MAYEVVMPYHLHMPSYFLETFTEYPFLYHAKPQLSPFRNSLKYIPLPHIKRNLTVYEIDKTIIYCCWEIGI